MMMVMMMMMMMMFALKVFGHNLCQSMANLEKWDLETDEIFPKLKTENI
jgi:hypothetical protein